MKISLCLQTVSVNNECICATALKTRSTEQLNNINTKAYKTTKVFSGGSRISRWGGAEPLRGCQLLTQAHFGENICENERIGSHWGGRRRRPPPPGSANGTDTFKLVR